MIILYFSLEPKQKTTQAQSKPSRKVSEKTRWKLNILQFFWKLGCSVPLVLLWWVVLSLISFAMGCLYVHCCKYNNFAYSWAFVRFNVHPGILSDWSYSNQDFFTENFTLLRAPTCTPQSALLQSKLVAVFDSWEEIFALAFLLYLWWVEYCQDRGGYCQVTVHEALAKLGDGCRQVRIPLRVLL